MARSGTQSCTTSGKTSGDVGHCAAATLTPYRLRSNAHRVAARSLCVESSINKFVQFTSTLPPFPACTYSLHLFFEVGTPDEKTKVHAMCGLLCLSMLYPNRHLLFHNSRKFPKLGCSESVVDVTCNPINFQQKLTEILIYSNRDQFHPHLCT